MVCIVCVNDSKVRSETSMASMAWVTLGNCFISEIAVVFTNASNWKTLYDASFFSHPLKVFVFWCNNQNNKNDGDDVDALLYVTICRKKNLNCWSFVAEDIFVVVVVGLILIHSSEVHSLVCHKWNKLFVAIHYTWRVVARWHMVVCGNIEKEFLYTLVAGMLLILGL